MVHLLQTPKDIEQAIINSLEAQGLEFNSFTLLGQRPTDDLRQAELFAWSTVLEDVGIMRWNPWLKMPAQGPVDVVVSFEVEHDKVAKQKLLKERMLPRLLRCRKDDPTDTEVRRKLDETVSLFIQLAKESGETLQVAPEAHAS